MLFEWSRIGQRITATKPLQCHDKGNQEDHDGVIVELAGYLAFVCFFLFFFLSLFFLFIFLCVEKSSLKVAKRRMYTTEFRQGRRPRPERKYLGRTAEIMLTIIPTVFWLCNSIILTVFLFLFLFCFCFCFCFVFVLFLFCFVLFCFLCFTHLSLRDSSAPFKKW